jgi:hypothetical protein
MADRAVSVPHGQQPLAHDPRCDEIVFKLLHRPKSKTCHWGQSGRFKLNGA